MEVILKENFPSLGYVGDKVKVRRGFARNFLIPRGVAIEATTRNERLLTHLLQGVNAKRIRLRADAEALAKKLESAKLEFVLKVGEKGKSFGSITVKDIEQSLANQGHSLDRKQIRLPEAIRKAGTYKALLKLHSEITVTLPVVVALEATQAARKVEAGETPGAETKPKKTRSRKKVAEAEKATEEAAEEK